CSIDTRIFIAYSSMCIGLCFFLYSDIFLRASGFLALFSSPCLPRSQKLPSSMISLTFLLAFLVNSRLYSGVVFSYRTCAASDKLLVGMFNLLNHVVNV